MKNKKVITLVCCLALVAAMSLGATVAYLTADGSVTNTFTVGKINPPVDPKDPTHEDPSFAGYLDEVKVDVYGVEDEDSTARVLTNEYKLIPGHEYIKDPTVHIGPDSEACYIFVKIENGISAVTEEITLEKGWTAVGGEENVWYKKCSATEDNGKNEDFVVFKTFKVKDIADADALAEVADASIVVNAYIIQSDGFASVDDAWKEVNPEPSETPKP